MAKIEPHPTYTYIPISFSPTTLNQVLPYLPGGEPVHTFGEWESEEGQVMAYNSKLAKRVRKALPGESELSERKMFGGIAFMMGEHMCCGVLNNDLIVRVGPDGYDEAMTRPNTRPMDSSGKPMRGLVFVDEGGTRADPALKRWVQRGVDYVKSLDLSQ